MLRHSTSSFQTPLVLNSVYFTEPVLSDQPTGEGGEMGGGSEGLQVNPQTVTIFETENEHQI